MAAVAGVELMPTGPADDGSDEPFWSGLREGLLCLPRCADCETWRPLGRALCSSCWSFATRWDQIRPQGRIYTWIRSRRAFMSELDVPAPYVTVLVELEDAPVRLLGILRGVEGDPAIGDLVTGVIEQPANAAWPVLRWTAEASA